ncbi:hypothetical protein HYALB_00006615 [Hymenoscyphus albidus]|uniref:Uncharacterized protein n=1 Tax=Hymenoscyphus albidus TaxID=595503 RepID=A0A9N9LR61_9HELO|nr:hypothetical protein HYALB_00006615 [Hymenoscyphus albidus]
MSSAVHTLLINSLTTIKPNPEVEGNFPLDEAVIEQFPPGTKVVAADSYGSSSWTVTARISTILADGTPKLWFLKCATEKSGKTMLKGEFHSMTEIYKTMPSFAPEPYAWGKVPSARPRNIFLLERVH